MNKGETTVKVKKTSSVSNWKEKMNKTSIIDLPSGTTIEIKKLNMFECVTTGYLPMNLLQEMISTASKMGTPEGWGSITTDELKKLIETARKVAIMAVVSPIVTEDGKANTMNVSDIDENDLFTIFGLAMQGGARNLNLAPFPKK